MVTLGEVIEIAKTPECLGIQDRDRIITYLKRAVGNLYNKAKWDLSLATMDVCVDGCNVTLPSEVGIPEGITVNGTAAIIRNDWYEYNVNNGSGAMCLTGALTGGMNGQYSFTGGGGERFSAYVDDKGNTPIFRQITGPSYLCALGLDSTDTGKYIRVLGTIIDPVTRLEINARSKNPETNEIEEGIFVGITSASDAKAKYVPNIQLKTVTRVIKPVTNGPIKLIAMTGISGDNAVTVGYYEPHETNPLYRRLRISAGKCAFVRIKYKKQLSAWRYKYDHDIVPVPHLEVIVAMLRATRKYDTSDYEGGAAEETRAITMMNDHDNANKQGSFSLQVPPGAGFGTMFWG